MSTTFRVAVIDDKWKTRKREYELISNFGSINFEYVENSAELCKLSQKNYDGFLVDLNLVLWGTTARDVIENHLATLNRITPIFLISAYLHDNKFNREAQLAREAAGVAYCDTFAWNDYADQHKDGRINESDLEVVYQRLLRSLSGWHAQIKLEDAQDLRILHLSDPQFGDPLLNPKMRFNEELISAAIYEKFDQPRNSGDLVDLVVISGDITYSGQKSEFDQAKTWITQALLPKLFPSTSLLDATDRLYLCPGNHDVNLRVLALERLSYNFRAKDDSNERLLKESPSAERSYSKLGLHNYYEFLTSLDREAAKSVRIDSSLNWVSNRFLSSGLQLLILNTASEISATNPDKAAVNDAEVSLIKNQLVDTNVDPSKVIICIGHHPIRSTQSTQRVIEDGNKLQNIFRGRSVALYLHGHSHAYDVDALIPGKCLAVLSPSSSVSVYNGRQGFNVVTLKRTNQGSKELSSTSVHICEFHENGSFQWLTPIGNAKKFSYR